MLKQSSKRFPVVLEIQTGSTSLPALLEKLSPTTPNCLWEHSKEYNQTLAGKVFPAARYVIAGVWPKQMVIVENDNVQIFERLPDFSMHQSETKFFPQEDPLAALKAAVDEFLVLPQLTEEDWREAEFPGRSLCATSLPPFLGGVIGSISYDTARYFERVKGMEGNRAEPDIVALFLDTALIADREEGKTFIVSWPEEFTDEGYSYASFRAEMLCKLLAETVQIPTQTGAVEHADDWKNVLETSRLRFSRDKFISQVERAQEYICAGDIFQVVLSNDIAVSTTASPYGVYEQLVHDNPSAFHFLVNTSFGNFIVGSSPEQMLSSRRTIDTRGAEAQKVTMRLVAGTYPRDDSSVTLPESILSDQKERAEHIMLVDHARNDIGRVSQIGSVKVEELLSVETYSTLHHLVSQVSGTLRPEVDIFSALKSCFPIATLTGTPKIRAMEIIAELEGRSRGVFGGAVFVLDLDSQIDSAVCIRTLISSPDGARIPVGAGIVFQSVPEREYEECLWKARAVLQAIGRQVSFAEKE